MQNHHRYYHIDHHYYQRRTKWIDFTEKKKCYSKRINSKRQPLIVYTYEMQRLFLSEVKSSAISNRHVILMEDHQHNNNKYPIEILVSEILNTAVKAKE